MSTASVSKRCAKDIMTREPVCVDADMTLRQVARVLEENEVSGAPVVDGHGCLVGVISRTDIVRRIVSGEGGLDPSLVAGVFADDDEGMVEWSGDEEPRAEDLMNEDPVTAEENTPVTEIARKMVEGRVHRVIVIDRLRIPIGIVTSLDLVKLIAE